MCPAGLDHFKEFGSFRVVEEGSLVDVREGATGIFKPFIGKRVVLGANGELFPITDAELQLATITAEYDPLTPPMSAPASLETAYPEVLEHPSSQAEQEQTIYGTYVHNPFGGYRHCVAACLLVRRYGSLGSAGIEAHDLLFERFSDATDSPICLLKI